VETREFVFAEAHGAFRRLEGIRTSARTAVDRIRTLCGWPAHPALEWRRGFLAGVFDAEGSYSGGVLRISNKDWRMLETIRAACEAHGFDAVIEPPSTTHAGAVRVRGGLRQHLRFFHQTSPAIARKRSIAGSATKAPKRLGVVAVEHLGFDLLMFDVTTGTGDFIANGVVSHNCYARPRTSTSASARGPTSSGRSSSSATRPRSCARRSRRGAGAASCSPSAA
jgi:hypothetical protein